MCTKHCARSGHKYSLELEAVSHSSNSLAPVDVCTNSNVDSITHDLSDPDQLTALGLNFLICKLKTMVVPS